MKDVKNLAIILLAACTTCFSAWVSAATWRECNDTPVRPKYPPMEISWDQCSIPPGSSQERAFFSSMFETRHYVHALGLGAGYKRIHNGQCLIEHDNGRSDTAVVRRADIDGRLGLTISETDGCNFSWEEERIITADVMVSNDLNFTRADESVRMQQAPAGTRIGAMVYLHELGHALGLEHSSGFSVMRDGLGAGVPFVGMTPASGGLGSELMGDDVNGIAGIYGYDPSYRNVFVASQLLRNGMLINNDADPTRGDVAPSSTVMVCPGDTVNLYASVGNNSSVREAFNVAIYIDADRDQYYPAASGVLSQYSLTMGRGAYSFPVKFIVPASIPVNKTMNVYVAIPNYLPADRKGYDHASRSRLTIRRKPGC